MVNIATCPTCGSKRIRRVSRTVEHSSKGQVYEVPSVKFHECPDCGEKLYGHEAMRKLETWRTKLKATG